MTPKVFLSYSSKNTDEVDILDRELRRRGVPLWRDRSSLSAGHITAQEIERAANEASGFVFYLTLDAAESKWVREIELGHARRSQALRSGIGIVPIFRDERQQVSARMVERGEGNGATAQQYDLSAYSGYVVRRSAVETGQLGAELRQAARKVLGFHAESRVSSNARSASLSIGLVTRGGSLPAGYQPDFLVDWTPDYEPSPPDRQRCTEDLAPALDDLRQSIGGPFSQPSLRVIPQCHLSMALAFGYSTRRNTGGEFLVVEPHSKEEWPVPASPLPPLAEAWSVECEDLHTDGPDLVWAINLTRNPEDFRGQLRQAFSAGGPSASQLLLHEPSWGPSPYSLKGRGPEVHQLAVAAVDELMAHPAYHRACIVHLALACPAGFAVLLAQQLSNTRPIQTYEWQARRQTYTPAFELVSS